jgi:hypothetical protein
MRRREFCSLPLALAAPPLSGEALESYFLEITQGFLRATERTTKHLTATEFEDATITRGFVTKSGLSTCAVTRMMPAMAAWILSGRSPDLLPQFRRMIVNATDPECPDAWTQVDRSGRQAQVEASVVAYSAWLLRDRLLPDLTPQQRKNLADWLTSSAKYPVRSNNWAWFTAVVQAVLLSLSEKYAEFRGDEAFMLEDLRVLDSMAKGESGWYNDGLKGESYDYYNSWVFASHFLYWNQIIGARYPQWRDRFARRLRTYLSGAEHFFGADGAHVLFGRSLIYRWGVLTPLVLAYLQGMWPSSPGRLREIVMGNIQWHRAHGAFDSAAGKLRESMTPEGTLFVKEPYIDGGHPYWGMQAFALWLIPKSDPFWTAPPVAGGAGTRVLVAPGLVLQKSSKDGGVRLYSTSSWKGEPHYRDKYNKFAYSSFSGFCVNHRADAATWDNALVLHDRATGKTISRGPSLRASVSASAIEMEYEFRHASLVARVRTRIEPDPKDESRDGRTHVITLQGAAPESMEWVEGSWPLREESRGKASVIEGWKTCSMETLHDHVLWGSAKCWVMRAPVRSGETRLSSAHITTCLA